MSYTRTTTVNPAPGGDTVKSAILDLDTDLTGAFTNLNTHEALTTGVHGAGAGSVVTTTGTQTLTNKTIQADDGTVSAPTISFDADTNTGIYRIGADNLGVACNGAKVLDVGTTGLAVTGSGAFTGNITNTAAINTDSILTLAGSGAYNTKLVLNGAGGGTGQVTSGASLTLNAATGCGVFTTINYSNITAVTSTGLAVTGSVSSTNDITITSTAGTTKGIYINQTAVAQWGVVNEATTGALVITTGGNDWVKINNTSGLTNLTGGVAIASNTPASAGAAGVAGTIAWDANYIYVCVATNTWKRVAIATW